MSEQRPGTAIDFYFDFSSPYGYLAACRIDELAARHGRTVRWRPYLMGAAFKTTDRRPMVEVPLVGEYGRRDMARSARLLGVPFRLPERFPVASVAACRAYYWLSEQDAETAVALARALLAGYFVEGRDLSDVAVVTEAAAALGVDPGALRAALGDASVKQRLREETDAAIARGVFGSPFFIVDGEPFWGHDRMDHVERWISTGGW